MAHPRRIGWMRHDNSNDGKWDPSKVNPDNSNGADDVDIDVVLQNAFGQGLLRTDMADVMNELSAQYE